MPRDSHPQTPEPMPELTPRQALAQELAERLAEPAGVRTLRLAQLHGLVAPSKLRRGPGSSSDNDGSAGGDGPAGEDIKGREGPRPVSVWSPVGKAARGSSTASEELVFERPEPHPLGDQYAVRRRIPARAAAGTRRVCFFGESVAAGYLFAPHLTPAGVLEVHLNEVDGEKAWEVVDLARTNETLASLTATVEASMQLAPDVLVIFAGNNWNLLETPELSLHAPGVGDRQRYAAALREGGLGGPVKLARRRRRGALEAAVGRIAALAEERRIPVVWLVPEVNLGDWQSRQPVPWLPGDGVARWHRTLDAGLEAVGAGRAAEVRRLAEELQRLDGGWNPTGHRLEALGWQLSRGDAGEAGDAAQEALREAARREVDAQHYPLLAHLGAPQAGREERRWIHELAPGRLRVVDLPEILRRHGGAALPGRRYFLDYCHLTAEGMHVAMAAVAAEVLSVAAEGAGDRRWEELLRTLPAPSPSSEAVALASFSAAIHSAHRLLPVVGKGEVLRFWCAEALAASEGIAEAMVDFVSARCAPLPAVLTAAQRRNLISPYRLQLQHGWRWDGSDLQLLLALRAVLGERFGAQGTARWDAAVGSSGTSRRPAVDLLDPRGQWEPVERFLPDAMELDDLDAQGLYRASWPRSRFGWVGGGDAGGTGARRCQITARLPAVLGEPREGEIQVFLGEQPIARLQAGPRWRSWAVELPAAMIRSGINQLTVRWPEMPPLSAGNLHQDPLAWVARELEEGKEADLHPVFGEIYRLVLVD
ncbi:MAG: hypothetical protein SX243_08695 [Acidobacteriota bacterium]|nr:hypothetical protein [Acidobacteriota bacterium]